MGHYRRRTAPAAWHALCVSLIALLCALMLPASAQAAPKTVLVVGDSLSAEYGIAYGTGWVALLNERAKAERIEAKIVNASISGDTTSGGKSRLPPLLAQHKPAVVIIELGGNDGLRGLPLASTEANLRAMIAAARQAKAKVLLTGIQIPPNYGASYASSFAAMYAKLAKETKSALVPFLLASVADRRDLFQPDGIHPVAGAQPQIAANVWPHLKPLLK
ncbi:MAG: arylesterase [Burkholderiaceae bacterium]|nr:arylesterase [Burkholderiaceae bacterium]